MDPMSEYLARMTIDARLASAQERRPGRHTEDARRAELGALLEEAAHRVAEQGTASERRLLEVMSEVAAPSAPGAAAALADPDGSETSRLRAFGLVHGHLLNALGPRAHARLLDLLDGPDSLERPRSVA